MNIPGQDVLSTSWSRVRDAGSAVGELASQHLNGGSLAKALPAVKDFVATGAGLAIAKRGAKVALTTVRRHPVAAIASAVALAGVGLAVMAAKKRKAAAEAEGNGRAKPKRLAAASRRGAAAADGERTRARATRARKPRGDAE